MLPGKKAKEQKGRLVSYSAIVNNLLKQYKTDDNIVTVDADIRTFKQQGLTETDYSQ